MAGGVPCEGDHGTATPSRAMNKSAAATDPDTHPAPSPPAETPAAATKTRISSLLLVYVIWSSRPIGHPYRGAVIFPPFQMAGGRFCRRGSALALWLRLRGDPLPTGRQWLASIPGVRAAVPRRQWHRVHRFRRRCHQPLWPVMSATTPLFAALIETLRGSPPAPRRVAGHGVRHRRGQRAHAAIRASAQLSLPRR